MEPPGDLDKIIPTPKEQALLFCDSLLTPMIKDQTWYLIDQSWMKTFRRFTGLEEAERYEIPKPPGPINNEGLIGSYGHDIRNGLVEELDFALVPESTWDLLVSWYGLCAGQEPIPRKAIEFGTFVKHCKIEVYPIPLNLCDNFELIKPVVFKFSAADLVEKIESVMRSIFQIPTLSDVRLWGSYSSGQFDLLPINKAIQDIPLAQNQYVVIESKTTDEEWEPPLITSTKLSKHSISYVEIPPSTVKGQPLQYNRSTPTMPPAIRRCASSTVLGVSGYGSHTKPGLSGLVNIGNTCFMNSIIQCLSNCPPLTYYFVNDLHVSEINYSNLLGGQGEIAKSFGDLMQMLWAGRHAAVIPDKFKSKIGQFSSQFSTGNQQDSQEFMVFFLDLLHEDLNRVSIKPVTPPISYDSRPDNELAADTWNNYKLRNDSFIVDNFHGLLKSRVVCPTCEKVSSTFDPFVFLSLPLLMRKERDIQVRHIPFNQSQDIADYVISVPCDGTVQDIFLEMGRYNHVPIDNMILADVINNHCHQFFSSDELISSIKDNRLMLFDVPVKVASVSAKSHIIMPVILWEVDGMDDSLYELGTLFGNPFLVVLPSSALTYQALYSLIVARMTRYILGCSEIPSTSQDTNKVEVIPMELEMTPLKLFIMNGIDCRDAVEIADNGSLISFEDAIGETIVVQWTMIQRDMWYKKPIPAYHNTNLFKFPFKLTLEDCLGVFITAEKLGSDDSWICPECKVHKRASKKFDLWQLPPVLVFHLKRFSYKNGKREKIDILVDFPTSNLHMEKFTCTSGQEPMVYDLFGVCNHFGTSHAGHYTAFCKNQRDQKWYCFDDSVVNPLKESKVVTQAAYLLFYVRKGLDIPKLVTPSVSASSSATSTSCPADVPMADSVTNIYSSVSDAAIGTDLVTVSSTAILSPTGSECTIGSGGSGTDTGIESDADMPLSKD